MNCNIINLRNNNKNEISPATITNDIKNLPDKNYSRYKNRSQIDNNIPYKPYRYQKYKKFNKRSDEQFQTDCEFSKSNHINSDHNTLESFPVKFTNGNENLFSKNERFPAEKMFEMNKRKFNVSSSYSSKLEGYTVNFDSDLPSNATIVENAKVIAKEITNNPLSMENQLKDSTQEECSHVVRSDKRKYKWTNKKHTESRILKSSEKVDSTVHKNHSKIKLNFLQESQLTSEQLADTNSSNNNKSVKSLPSVLSKPQVNGLNPSAIEFTPSVEKKINVKSEKNPTEIIENRIKDLNINETDNGCQQTITNPVVFDDSGMNQPFNFSFYDQQFPTSKIPTAESTVVQNMYPYQLGRPLSQVNYNPTQTIVPQFQVALYNNNPQLIRYNNNSSNQSQNVPLNLPGSYLVYSPVMINGMYNSLLSNRLFPIGGNQDIPTPQFAHPFSGSTGHAFFSDSITHNTSHIR